LLIVISGLYIPDHDRWPEHFRGIGIRIEDSICVGDDSPISLSAEAVKEVSDTWLRSLHHSHLMLKHLTHPRLRILRHYVPSLDAVICLLDMHLYIILTLGVLFIFEPQLNLYDSEALPLGLQILFPC
jgi:hypothetical protein